MKNNNNKITIITARASFPNGFGATSIIQKYAKGFLKLGFNCDVLLLRPTEFSKDSENYLIKGFYNKVYFEYMSKSNVTSHKLFTRVYLYSIGLLRTVSYLFKNKNKIHKIVFYSPDYLISTLSILLISYLFSIECIGIKTESSYSDSHRISKKYWKIKEYFIYKWFKKMVVITSYLESQLREFGYNNRIEKLPIIIDEEMYDGIVSKETQSFDLLYIGTLGYKEELYKLIQILEIVKDKVKEVKLNIIGKFINTEFENEIMELIKSKKLDNSIIFHGYMKYSEIPYFLSCCDVMILPRIETEYSKAGFPIKLAEYLLSGKPTIVSKTGEIDNFLTHNKNALLIDPYSNVDFAEAIISVFTNYEFYRSIGMNGREIALKSFSSIYICRKIIE